MKTGDEMANAYSTVSDRGLPVQRGVKGAIAIVFLARAGRSRSLDGDRVAWTANGLTHSSRYRRIYKRGFPLSGAMKC